MKSTLENLEGLSRKLSIQVPADHVRDAFEKVYKGIQRNATIKGFRQGKAPMATIRSMYKDRVQQDVIQDLIADTYQKAVEEHKLDPVGFPKVSFDQFSEESDFSYAAELEIRPEIQLKKYDGLKVEKDKFEITDKNIDDVLQNLRESQADQVPVFEDRGAIMGDIAEVDFEGFVDGQPLPQGKADGYSLELGSGRSIPGFEDGIVGMKIGERREIHVNFPADYHAKDVAGKAATFNITVKGLKKKALPELNDEFAAKIGAKGTLQELREEIRKDLTAGEEKRVNDELKNKIMRALVEENPIPVPNSLLKQQKEALHKDVQDRMRQQGLNSEEEFEEYKKKWDSDFDQSAKFMVQSTFLVDALADKLDLRATKEEIETRIDEHAKTTGIDRAQIEKFYADRERRSRLFFQITEEKVAKYLIEKADIR